VRPRVPFFWARRSRQPKTYLCCPEDSETANLSLIISPRGCAYGIHYRVFVYVYTPPCRPIRITIQRDHPLLYFGHHLIMPDAPRMYHACGMIGEDGVTGKEMAMSKASQDLITLFEDVITDTMFIGSSRDDLAKEIRTNMWGIALSDEQCELLTTSDLLDLVARITKTRQQQLDQANGDHGMVFYLWCDQQALQLRFNLISDVHEHLPFACQLNLVTTPEPILDRYLRMPSHEEILRRGLQDVSEAYTDDAAERPLQLDVYQLRLDPHHPLPSW